ncbi:chemotaxis protein CheX [Palleronia abyssalis]|uniref:STAS domain-containing protein n=1 Tax=Palleronia abyssalis TaxID=1501240 RepID=A0A2R8BUM3_9RHOB|nr:chemotaxis protein CheX [Palleronia abyssalis]SPJ23859.1 hypothetical protein PAA8504_01677 [Palleronia abyssalis]
MIPPIKLPKTLKSADAEALRECLAAASGDAELDGTEVQALGGLCAQELLIFHKRQLKSNYTVRINASPELYDDLQLLGLADLAREKGESQ